MSPRPDSFEPPWGVAPFAAHHAEIRRETRAWVAEHLAPYADEWEAAREYPREIVMAAGRAGLLGWKYPKIDGGCGPDLLADIVVSEELTRCGSGGVAAGLGATKDLAPYYVSRFGTAEQREHWLRPTLRGEAVAGLAVTEPGAGSDVAALRCTAKPDSAGGWVLNGEKSFCTNGSRADWLLVAARTAAEPGARGLSLLIVPTTVPGFTASRIPTLGWRTSQTGLISFTDVHLGPEALLAEPGQGFVMIMKSFQWERLALAVAAVATTGHDLDVIRDLGGVDHPEYPGLVRAFTAVRALTYDALGRFLAGAEPVAAVSGAKWRACDLAVEAAALRHAVAASFGGHDFVLAERALRDARLGPIGGGTREVMAELVSRQGLFA